MLRMHILCAYTHGQHLGSSERCYIYFLEFLLSQRCLHLKLIILEMFFFVFFTESGKRVEQ